MLTLAISSLCAALVCLPVTSVLVLQWLVLCTAAFDYVTSLSPSALASHGIHDPLPEPVEVEFDVFNCQAGQLPSLKELDNYDGFYITGSLAGVCESTVMPPPTAAAAAVNALAAAVRETTA